MSTNVKSKKISSWNTQTSWRKLVCEKTPTILSCGNPSGGKRGRGRPLSTWLRQMEGFYRRVGIYREQAWALVKEDALAYRDSWRASAMRGGAILLSK